MESPQTAMMPYGVDPPPVSIPESNARPHASSQLVSCRHDCIVVDLLRKSNASGSGCWLDDLNDDVLFRIFRATVGRPFHFASSNQAGVTQEPYDDFFGDRKGIHPMQNPEYPMVFVLPRVCRRWRYVMEKFPAIWSRASVIVEECPRSTPSPLIPLKWWTQHADRLESLYLDGHHTEALGDLTSLHIGVLSLLSVHHMKALCLVDSFANGATDSVLAAITYLTNLVQLQVYRASPSFVHQLPKLTNLSKLKVLELGYNHGQGTYPYTELSCNCFPLSLEKLALCEALLDMDLQCGGYLTNLKCLTLMSTAATGGFCEHLGNLPLLTKLVLDDSSLDGNGSGETSALTSDYLPEDLYKLSALENIKDLTIQGLETGQRGYFEWLGEEVLRDPPFSDLHSLSLCFSSLGVMSDAFDKYENLTYLNIAQIRFETLPEPVLRLPNLVRLEMISCEINTFPEMEPCCSESISVLNLCGNKLRVIPRGLAFWRNLATLEFTENPIMDFANIECLLQLPRLKAVMLLEGEKSLDMSTIDVFCQEFAHMSTALKLGYVCAKLAGKEPSCQVFL